MVILDDGKVSQETEQLVRIFQSASGQGYEFGLKPARIWNILVTHGFIGELSVLSLS